VVLEWEGGRTADLLADAVVAVLLQVRCLGGKVHGWEERLRALAGVLRVRAMGIRVRGW
jgi:hypothetical protein